MLSNLITVSGQVITLFLMMIAGYCLGKTKLLPRSARIEGGQIIANGADITGYSQRDMNRLRGKLFSMVLQDPMTALDLTQTVEAQIAEAVRVHSPRLDRQAVHRRVMELMELVGIPQPEKRGKLYPYHFSGGQRQRVVMAIALAADPKILLADEPTTALDVTVQAQILDLLKDIQHRLHTATILVSHSLSQVREMCSKVLWLHRGRQIDFGDTAPICDRYQAYLEGELTL